MPTDRHIRRDEARRPVATDRRAGQDSPSVAQGGFFVPALPADLTNHSPGELYSLGDGVTVEIMRLLLDAGVDRQVVARVGEELPAWGDEWVLSIRKLGASEPPWWCAVPLDLDELERRSEPRYFDEPRIRKTFVEFGIAERDGLLWAPEVEPLIVFVPVSKFAAQMAAAADEWRRQRRIPPKDWPPWM